MSLFPVCWSKWN